MVVSNNPSKCNVTGELACSGLQLNNRRQKLRQRFDILRKLGQGTYGKVQLALNKETGEEVAIKTIKKAKIETEQDLIRIQREIQIMSSIQHPHIIHIYEVFENKEKIVLVMEYACGGELYDFLNFKKNLSESEARRIFRQIASAVYYCHKSKICHRDLKLENILLDEKGNAKIADFGLSNVFGDSKLLDTFCGSPLYASPEIVKGTPYYGPEVDCWSLGVLLYTLVYGAMPFDGSNFRRLVKQISEGDYYEPKKPSEASMLIRRLLTVTPAKRATIEDVCEDWWVNLSYDDSLLAVAEQLGKVPPIKLEYLLQPRVSDATSVESETSKDEKESVLSNSTMEDNLSIQDEPNDNDEEPIKASPEIDKKHHLTPSQTSLTEKTVNKRQKKITVEEIESHNQPEAKLSTDAEKAVAVSLTSDSEKDVTVEPEPVITEPNETDSGPSVEENYSINNEPTIVNIPELTNAETTKITSQACPELDTKENEVKETKMEKINVECNSTSKLSSSSDTAEENNTDLKPKPKPRSASLKTNTLTPAPKDRKSSLVYPGLKVSEARRAFESKQTEKKSIVIPSLKVSTARKAFETSSNVSSTALRRASMPPKLKIAEPTEQPPTKLTEQSPSGNDTNALKTKESSKSQKKTAGFLPTLDVTVAVKPRKDVGKPPLCPRADASTTSGTSSGENTPEVILKAPPSFKGASSPTRRASYPKSNSASAKPNDNEQATENRTRTLSETDSLSVNAPTTSGDSSLKSSSSTLTGAESFDQLPCSALSDKVVSDHIDSKEIKEDKITEEAKMMGENKKVLTDIEIPQKPPPKISSMEIQLSSNCPQPQQDVKSPMIEPQFVLRQPPGGGKFTLLGVTSEVTFDVAAAPPEDVPTVEIKTAPRKQSSNLFMSVTLPAPPPPTDDGSDREESTSEASSSMGKNDDHSVKKLPQRISTRKTDSEKQSKLYNRGSLKRDSAVKNAGERYYREMAKDCDTLPGSNKQGYSVYRSKYCSLQKAFLNDRTREASVERSESFSSTGSMDDLEDIYDSFALGNNNSQIQNIFGQTQFSSDDLSRPYSRRSTSLSGHKTKLDNYEDSSPIASSSGIGSSRSSRQLPDRSNMNSRASWSSAHYRSSTSSTPVREFGSDIDSYMSDSSTKNRWYHRNPSQEDDPMTSSLTRRRSMYGTYSRSVSEDDSQSTTPASEVSYPSTNSIPPSHSPAKYVSNSAKRTSLSSRFRSGKTDEQVSPSCYQSTNSQDSKPQHQYNSSFTRRRRVMEDEGSHTNDEATSFTRDSSVPVSSRSNASNQKESFDVSVYGTIRRPKLYSKSSTQELLSEQETNVPRESRQTRRPRSLILTDGNDDWSKQSQSDKREATRSRASTSFETLDGLCNSGGNIKKKPELELESQYAQQVTQSRGSRFAFRRAPSQERAYESSSGVNPREQIPFWRAGSHGREIGTSWSKRMLSDENKPGLLRRASLSEEPRGRSLSENGKGNTLPNGAAEYWARRYGTTSRVHPPSQKMSTSMIEETKDDKPQRPVRRRSLAGIESDAAVDNAERTRGLLQYARTISQELNQLHSDLTESLRRRKLSQSENEVETVIENSKSITDNDIKNVEKELKSLENDLLSLGAKPNCQSLQNGKSQDGRVNEVKALNPPKKDEKINGKEDEGISSEDGTATPTDPDDTCSLCSDYENRSGTSSGLEESVHERIRRKSYFARFQDKKNKHQNRSNLTVENLGVNRCRHRREKTSSESVTEENKSLNNETQPAVNSRHSMPKDIRLNNTEETEENESTEANSEVNSSITKENSLTSPPTPSNRDPENHSVRASSVVPELLESSSTTYSKPFYRHHSISDSLRPTSPITRRLSMLDSMSSVTNGDLVPSYHMGSGWSTYDRRKSRPFASIMSSLPLEATAQTRANFRSRHDYLINRALSSLDERNTRPISPGSRRPHYHDNHVSSTDMRRFSAILDNSSPRDVIRKALDVCNSLQY